MEDEKHVWDTNENSLYHINLIALYNSNFL